MEGLGPLRNRPQAPRPYTVAARELKQPLKRRSILSEYAPIVFGGLLLVSSFALAGHYLGRNAVAHNANLDAVPTLISPTSVLATKGSLLPDGETFDLVNVKILQNQIVETNGKGDFVADDDLDLTGMSRQPKIIAKIENESKIEPAAIDLKAEKKIPAKRLALAPLAAKPAMAAKTVKIAKLDKTEKQKVVAQRRIRLAEENCLARAVYFEARSESDLGQLAVAKVILNRAKNPNFPKSICGVVYQGSQRRNSCQFSFACDGLPDDVRQPAAWAHAKSIAQRAMSGEAKMGSAMGSATNYHADYVKPKWSKTMRRLVKIGRHVFYAGG
jgi:spore germination cell wall hydrolase CwlJ-like protein